MPPSSSVALVGADEGRPGSRADSAQGPVTEVRANANLRGADLSGRDLSGCDLSGADLTEADLSGANLAGADLRGSMLFAANLQGADFLGADLRGANLTQCRGASASFGGANLRDAVAFGAELDNVTLSRADLTGADFRTASMRAVRALDAELGAALFDGATLCEAVVEDCRCRGTSFARVDFANATLRQLVGASSANWVGARTRGVDFTGAYLLRRTILDQNYLHEFRSVDRAHAAIYWLWWASSDCGRSLSRWIGCVATVVLLFGVLYTYAHVDFGAHETWLSPYYFSVVTLTTLGYGDVLPVSAVAQALTMVEVGVGYMMLGGMLSIFANKMARRAD